jgi:hypothetical protein
LALDHGEDGLGHDALVWCFGLARRRAVGSWAAVALPRRPMVTSAALGSLLGARRRRTAWDFMRRGPSEPDTAEGGVAFVSRGLQGPEASEGVAGHV